nr:hypothetical protein [uncultured Prevotella sp.]
MQFKVLGYLNSVDFLLLGILYGCLAVADAFCLTDYAHVFKIDLSAWIIRSFSSFTISHSWPWK